MSTQNLVRKYETPPTEGNPRKTEAWALTQAALKMKAAQDSGDIPSMLAAVKLNWQLWTIIQSELLAPECTIPMDIRRNVLSLANFIDKHTVGFIGLPKPEKINVLVSINRELAGGLYTVPADDGAAAESQPAAPAPGTTPQTPTDTSA